MKKFLLPAIAILLFATACKKENTRQTQQNNCPTNQTFVKDISASISNGKMISIQEDNEGNIHVEVNDQGNWLVYQFSAAGNFIRAVPLGIYQGKSWLAIKDGYYKVSYTESSIETYNNPGLILTGWKDLGIYTYNAQSNTCGKVIAYDTAEIYKQAYSATTTISKLDFEGNMIWNSNCAGYPPDVLGKLPIAFDVNGDIAMVTIDYKGFNRLLLINGQEYEVDDTTRPSFSLTDTILINDKVHGFFLNKISAATGLSTFQTHHIFDHFNKWDGPFVCCNVFTSGIWVVLDEQAYIFDLQGNYINNRNLVSNDCFAKHSVSYSVTSFDANYTFVRGDKFEGGSWNSYSQKLDFGGNVIWQTNASVGPRTVALSDGGYMGPLGGDGIRIYDANGTATQSFLLTHLVNEQLPNHQFSLYTALDNRSNISCSGDLLHLLECDSSGIGKHWLVRTNNTGGF